MPRVSQPVNSFNAGEFSPEFDGRSDLKKYGEGAKTIENFIVHPEGGVHRRSGTRFVASGITATQSRLVPFVFSTEQAYMLEFGSGVARVFADSVQVGVADRSLVHTDVNTTTDEFTFVDHGFVHNQGPFHFTSTPTDPPDPLVEDTDYWIVSPKSYSLILAALIVTGTDTITLPSAHNYIDEQGPFRFGVTPSASGELPSPLNSFTDYYIDVVTSTTIKLRLTPSGSAIDITTAGTGFFWLVPTSDYLRDTFKLTASDGGAPITLTDNPTGPYTFEPNPAGTPAGLPQEILTPFSTVDAAAMQYAQSADFLFFANGTDRPVQLTRSSNTQWALDSMNIIDGPYLEENLDLADTITTTGTSINTRATLTLTATTLINGGDGWDVLKDIGRKVQIRFAGDWGCVEIDSITSSTVAAGNILIALTSTGATEKWRMGAWYRNNYPKSISFFDQRLGFSGAANEPNVINGSKTGLFNVFSPTDPDGTVVDTSAVRYKVADNQVNAIQWLSLADFLYAGTKGAVFSVRASLEDEAITPTNIKISKATTIGSQSTQPVNVSNQVVYVTRNHQGLRGITSIEDRITQQPTDLNLLAKHVFGRTLTITDMAFQQDRQQVVWCVRSDGILAAVTYVPDQEVFAWHRHLIAGATNTVNNGLVKSVAVIPSSDESHDQVWLSVVRLVNSVAVQHIEFFEDEWLDDTATSMRYMDSAPVAYSGGATDTITGLDHLEGETVQVLADGAVHPDRVVASGSITLDNATYTDVLVGLGYTSLIESLKLEPEDPEGSSMGKVSRIDYVVARVWNTVGGELGPDTSNMDPILWSQDPPVMDAAPTPFTGDKKIAFAGPFAREKTVAFRQSQPLPFNLLSLNILQSTGPR